MLCTELMRTTVFVADCAAPGFRSGAIIMRETMLNFAGLRPDDRRDTRHDYRSRRIVRLADEMPPSTTVANLRPRDGVLLNDWVMQQCHGCARAVPGEDGLLAGVLRLVGYPEGKLRPSGSAGSIEFAMRMRAPDWLRLDRPSDERLETTSPLCSAFSTIG